jgi:hypothetical protein
MKKKLFIGLFSLSVISATAQIPLGSWYTGGSVSFNYNSDNDGEFKTTELKLMPQTFVQLSDNWAIGGGAYITTHTDKFTPSDSKTTTVNYGIWPGARYYGHISETVNCYLQGNVGHSWGVTKTTVDSFETKDKNFNFGFSVVPGISWNINKRTYIDFTYGNFSYMHSATKEDGSDDKIGSNEFILSLNPKYVTVGLYYIFGGEQ